jgi:hypothetical protein
MKTVYFRPILSLKCQKIMSEKEGNELLYTCEKVTFCLAKFASPGDLSFLLQWVSATSQGLDETALFRLAGLLLTMAKCTCPDFPTFWNCSTFSSPLLLHGEMVRHGQLCGEVAWSSLELLAINSPWRNALCSNLLFLVLA